MSHIPQMPLSRNGKSWLLGSTEIELGHTWKTQQSSFVVGGDLRCHFLEIGIMAASWHENRTCGIKLHAMQAFPRTQQSKCVVGGVCSSGCME